MEVDMFFLTKNSVRKEVVKAVAQSLQLCRNTVGTPAEMWRDPYCCGYLTGMMISLATIASNNKFSSAVKGEIAMLCAEDLGAPPDFSMRSVALLNERDKDYVNGMQEGSLHVGVAYNGVSRYQSEERVIKAQARISAQSAGLRYLSGPVSEQSEVASEIFLSGFVARIRALKSNGE
jgi:hypothetical protein